MRISVEVDCTPEEARRFMGLPDVSGLNDHIMAEMQKRVDSNMALLSGDELVKSWLTLGAGAQEQFRKMMEAGMNAATTRK
jgi:hypothetical protein